MTRVLPSVPSLPPVGLAASLALLGGCLGPADTDTEAEEPDDGPFIVGPEGGTHVFGDATLVVPQGAVDEEIEIRLIETEDDPPSPYVGLSRVWRAEPEGLVFAEPITIRLPIDEDDVEAVTSGELEPSFYWSDETGEGYERLEPALLNDGNTELRADVDHFSTGFIATIPVQSIVEPEPFPPADVLFIVDNSCSMFEEQTALATNMPSFLPFLQDSTLDYHIGVVSTDMSNTAQHAGKLQAASGQSWIEPGTGNPQAVFGQMVMMGTGGDFEEKGRAAAYSMVELKPDIPINQGFLREEGTLTFVFVSDEEDQSGGNPIMRAEFREWMETKRARPQDVVAHAIIDPPNQTCPQGDTPGQEYERYANWTGGVVLNLCEPDWSPFMEIIAGRLFDVARVQLDEPALEIVEVAITEDGVETVLTDADWTYDDVLTTVYLEPGIGSPLLESIRVDYTLQ